MIQNLAFSTGCSEHAPETPGMSWFDGQHDGKLHLWRFVPIRRPGEARTARWTMGRPVKRDNVFLSMSSQVSWRCAANELPLELRTVLPDHASKTTQGLHLEGTIIIDSAVAGCRLHSMPHCLQEAQ